MGKLSDALDKAGLGDDFPPMTANNGWILQPIIFSPNYFNLFPFS